MKKSLIFLVLVAQTILTTNAHALQKGHALNIACTGTNEQVELKIKNNLIQSLTYRGRSVQVDKLKFNTKFNTKRYDRNIYQCQLDYRLDDSQDYIQLNFITKGDMDFSIYDSKGNPDIYSDFVYTCLSNQILKAELISWDFPIFGKKTKVDLVCHNIRSR